jgi:hypothetical protein
VDQNTVHSAPDLHLSVDPGPGVPTYKGRSDVPEIIASIVLVNTRLYTLKNFPRNYPQFGHVPSEILPALS